MFVARRISRNSWCHDTVQQQDTDGSEGTRILPKPCYVEFVKKKTHHEERVEIRKKNHLSFIWL